MKNNLFDSYVKGQLGNYRPDVPSHIWEKIAAQTDRKKPIGFWGNSSGIKRGSVMLLLLAAFGSLSYLFYRNNIPA